MQHHRPILLRGRPIGNGAFPLIITPLVGHTAAAIVDEVAAIVAKRPDMLEWRVDFFEGLGDAAAVVDTARAIRRLAGPVPVLLTRRHRREGGQPITVDEPAVLAAYAAACEAGVVDLVDCEMANDPADLARLRAVSAANGVALVLSYHDFQGTPTADALLARFVQAAELGADVAKVAVMPRDPQDVLTLLGATYRASQTVDLPLISMSMGGLGSMSRVMGWIYGSAATFAVGQRSSAPGQIDVEELRALLAAARRAFDGA